MSEWTEPACDLLEKSWRAGLSASQTARVLNAAGLGPFTRSAVIGKVHRLGLNGVGHEDQPRRSTGNVPRVASTAPKMAFRKIRKRSLAQVTELPCKRRDDGGYITLLTIGKGECRWPIGDVGEPDFHFCGQPQIDTGSYCEHHEMRSRPTASVADIQSSIVASDEDFRSSGIARAFGSVR